MAKFSYWKSGQIIIHGVNVDDDDENDYDENDNLKSWYTLSST